MNRIWDVVAAIVIGVVSGVTYYFFTKDSNGMYAVAIIVGQVSYCGSTGKAKTK